MICTCDCSKFCKPVTINVCNIVDFSILKTSTPMNDVFKYFCSCKCWSAKTFNIRSLTMGVRISREWGVNRELRQYVLTRYYLPRGFAIGETWVPVKVICEWRISGWSRINNAPASKSWQKQWKFNWRYLLLIDIFKWYIVMCTNTHLHYYLNNI